MKATAKAVETRVQFTALRKNSWPARNDFSRGKEIRYDTLSVDWQSPGVMVSDKGSLIPCPEISGDKSVRVTDKPLSQTPYHA